MLAKSCSARGSRGTLRAREGRALRVAGKAENPLFVCSWARLYCDNGVVSRSRRPWDDHAHPAPELLGIGAAAGCQVLPQLSREHCVELCGHNCCPLTSLRNSTLRVVQLVARGPCSAPLVPLTLRAALLHVQLQHALLQFLQLFPSLRAILPH